MTKRKTTSPSPTVNVRLPRELWERITAVAKAWRPAINGATACELAVEEGLRVLEAEVAAKTGDEMRRRDDA